MNISKIVGFFNNMFIIIFQIHQKLEVLPKNPSHLPDKNAEFLWGIPIDFEDLLLEILRFILSRRFPFHDQNRGFDRGLE